jgi:tyrosyl-tRNA synthetase
MKGRRSLISLLKRSRTLTAQQDCFFVAQGNELMNSVLDTLRERGFVAQVSDEKLGELLAQQSVTVYAGFDPTADSLHLGHVVPIMALAHFQRAGHRVLLVVGGATGMIGDPSGRSEERNLLSVEQVAANAKAIGVQMGRYFDPSAQHAPTLLNNFDWIGRMSFIDWLRDVGKNFTLGYMLAKESVSRRLQSEHGISYTEFSYMTLQAYDFLYLFDHYGCVLQVGGSDQWGNITAGIDLIRRQRQTQVYGLTFHLITTSTGEKFGKSAGNAIWLDPQRTSPWDFYQYLVRQDDKDVIRFLKLYTFLPLDRIQELETATLTAPEKREAQKALAYEVTKIVHGEEVAREMAHAAEVVYHSEIRGISDDTLTSVFASVPSTQISRQELDAGIPLLDVLVRTSLAKSKNEARRALEAESIYINNVKVSKNQGDVRLSPQHLASPSFIVLRSGKKNYHLLRIR